VPPPTSNERLKVLLIEDDEDDYILTRSLFSEIKGWHFDLEWINNFDAGLARMEGGQHDVCLVDYRLGAKNGIDLLRTALEKGYQAPIILLTGQGEREIDLEAMKAGAADYLVKGRLDPGLLERSIRYAIERKRAAAQAAAEQMRLAAFGTEVGLALTQRDSLEAILRRCALAMVRYLNGALARIWIFDAEEKTFRLQASEGPVSEAEKNSSQQPKVTLSLETIANGQPILINQAVGDPRIQDQAWVKREGIVAYAGYPLMLEERVVGLMSLFSCNPLSESTLQEMASVANGIALCIESKRSAEALGASEFKYQSVVENIQEVIFQVDRVGCWTFLNPAWTSMTGFKLKETLGTRLSDYIHPEDRERHWELLQQLIARTQSFSRDEIRFLAKDGSFRWVEVYAQPTLDDHAMGASGTLRDITENKRSEAEIEKLAAFVRCNPDPVMELAADGSLSYLNPAAGDMARSLQLQKPEALLPAEAVSIARECLRLGRSKLRHEISIKGRTLCWSFFPIIGSQVVHCYGSDTTERLDLEAQLRHAQKLESIGQLAAGVAHDFNNILTIIQGHSDRLLAQCAGEERITEPLRQVSAAANRASSLTRQLLMFSRKQVMQPRVLDLNGVLGNMGKMLHRLLGEDIAVELKCAEGTLAIEADAGMIEQIIMNLAVNSRDAMPKGGQLLITTTTGEADDSYVKAHPEARSGRFVCLSVKDTGCGMDEQTQGRIFEPFYTTKEVGKGTGLGLATVYGIVKQHQGWIEVTSAVGAGTTFQVFLPRSAKAPEIIAEHAAAPAIVPGRKETILLVEDEPMLRELAKIILSDYEYQVLEASTGAEALRVWEAHHGQVDLLLTDMVMPEGMNGRELADKLKLRKPALKIIYTSGYSAEVMGAESVQRNIRFLQKPYPPPQLAQAVRECLDAA